MTKPKATQNKSKDVKVLNKREKLEAELGRLTYKIAILRAQIVRINEQAKPLIERSNQIATEFERMDNGQNI